MRLHAPLRHFAALLPILALLAGCANRAVQPFDYTAFKTARPASILVLPPLNSSPDIKASDSVMSHTSVPLAESGYYVFPVTLTEETFKQNGLTVPADIHALPFDKLRQIFGADAALYIDVVHYGTSYAVLASETRVTAKARLVDLRSGAELWNGAATASSAEGRGDSGGGLIGMLISAALYQIAETVVDHGHRIAESTDARLLYAGRPHGMLYGPRSPMYLKDGVPAE